MTIGSVLIRGRRAAEMLMTDTATITRAGASTFNPTTGQLTPTSTTVHTGPCNVRMPAAVEIERLFGEEQVTATRLVACFPHDVTGIELGDVVTVTESEDVDLVGVPLRVVALPRRSHVIYKGFACEVIE